MKKMIRELAGIGLGSIIMGLSMVAFLVPQQIAPGGVSGLATVLQYQIHIPAGTLMMALNAPLFICSWIRYGAKFTLYTLYSVVLMSVVTDYLPIPALTEDLLLSTVLGGVVMGAGLGLILRAGGNSGGTALLAQLIQPIWPHIQIPWLLFAVDACVVALSAFVFSLDLAFYALIALYLSSKVFDMVAAGMASAKKVNIITANSERMERRILTEMERGCTRIPATGTYSGQARDMLICIVKSSREIVAMKQLVRQVDPQAFLFVSDIREVSGEGFHAPPGH